MADQSHLDILQQGVEAWNSWRAQNSFARPSLSGADLSGVDLRKANLSEADLSGTNLHRDILEGHDVPEVLRHAPGFHQWCGVGHQRASDARLRMKLLNITAMSSITPTKTWNQSVLTPVKKIPCCTMPKMSAPKSAPITEP